VASHPQDMGQMGSNEPGGPGNNNAHGSSHHAPASVDTSRGGLGI
jgi:hypothetical protein